MSESTIIGLMPLGVIKGRDMIPRDANVSLPKRKRLKLGRKLWGSNIDAESEKGLLNRVMQVADELTSHQ
eukprot:IDg14705t1